MMKKKIQEWQIEILKEITEGFPPNHYYVNKNRTKLVAFYPGDDKDKFVIYKTPKNFSTRYRKFEVIATGLNSL
jgi:hypothetical protein